MDASDNLSQRVTVQTTGEVRMRSGRQKEKTRGRFESQREERGAPRDKGRVSGSSGR